MSVKMSDALRESINDINEILYAQKLIDKKEYERVSAQFSMAAVSTEMDGRQFAQIRRKLNLSQAALGQIRRFFGNMPRCRGSSGWYNSCSHHGSFRCVLLFSKAESMITI